MLGAPNDWRQETVPFGFEIMAKDFGLCKGYERS